MDDREPIHLFLGFDLDCRREVPVGEPPSNYKKDEAISKWRADERVRLDAEGHMVPTFGSVKAVVVLDDAGKTRFSADRYNRGDDYDDHDVTPSDLLVGWLVKEYGGRFSQHYSDSRRPPVVDYSVLSWYGLPPSTWYAPTPILVGFQVKACMKVACHEVMTDNQVLETPTAVPVGLWHGNDGGFLDPYEALVPSEHRKVVTIAGLLAAYNIEAGDGVDGAAHAARLLALRTQLIGYTA